MTKILISERHLIDEINLALKKSWTHLDAHCEVSTLGRASLPERNWEVTMTNTGGDFRRGEECQALIDRVLAGFVQKYDVNWWLGAQPYGQQDSPTAALRAPAAG